MIKCHHYFAGRCQHPEIKVAPTPEVCSLCELYRGPARGLGDRVAAVTSATGIAAVVRAVSAATGTDCGCAKRRAALNAAVPEKGT
jgi:hypothetical protein